jgi:predicted Zn-dependent protease
LAAHVVLLAVVADPPMKEKIEMSRREKIEAMLADEPGDTFLRYSLAMELRSEGNHDASVARLAELTRDDPPYIAAFFMAAQQLAEQGHVDQARTFLRDGIDQARRQGDSHAAAEMSELLASLGSLGEL